MTALRVLICDDVQDIRLLLRLALAADPDIEVVGEAEDGREAVDRSRDLQPDVVLLDLAMPVMDGLQALPEILRVAPGTRVVVLSGFCSEGMAERTRELGASAYLEKGVSAADVVLAVRRVPGA